MQAVSPLLDGVGGRYFEDCNEVGVVVPPANSGVADYALDPGGTGYGVRLLVELAQELAG